MISKTKKIKQLVWTSLFAFSVLILGILFFTQIVFLNKYYEIYKTNQLDTIAHEIKQNDNITISELEDMSYEYGICISIYTNNDTKTISNLYNRGCLIGDSKTNTEFITNFIDSNETDKTYSLKNSRFGNSNLVRALKYGNNLYIFLNTSIQPLDDSIVLLKRQFIYIAAFLMVISLIIVHMISNKISKPIENISDSAKKMASGNYDVNFSTKSNIVEIEELSNALELAQKEMSKTDELRKDLMANVGHDLRTPLTMIKAYAEMTRDLETQTPAKRKENLNIIIEETDRLNILVGDILDLSKLQSKTYELQIEEFDLNDLIKEIIRRYYILIDNEGYEFIYENDKSIMVKADKKRMEQVIYNLLNNAVNYTGSDKKIYINLIDKKKTILVEIKDTGKGIEEKDIKYIWDKYYHNEKKHKRNAFGTGLGLSIVKTILDTHGYKYGVKSKLGEGTTFYFEISKSK